MNARNNGRANNRQQFDQTECAVKKLRKLYRDSKKVKRYLFRPIPQHFERHEGRRWREDEEGEEEEEKIQEIFGERERETKARSHARENVQIKQSNKERRIFKKKKRKKGKKNVRNENED